MASNIETAIQLNKLIKDQNKLIEGTNQQLSKQLALYQNICKQMKAGCEEQLDDAAAGAREVTEALDEAADAAERAGSGMSDMGGSAKKSLTPLGMLKSLGKGLFSGLLIGLAKVIGMFKGFVTHAAEVYDQSLVIAKAQEELRDKFGDLSSGTGKAVVDLGKEMGSAFSEAGVSMGFGFAAAANLTNKMGELMGAMDPAHLATFNKMSVETRKDIMMAGLAMDQTGAEIGSLTQRFKSLGKNADREMKKMWRVSKRIEKRFGLDAKAVGKSMAKMSDNVKVFGNLSVEGMGRALSAAAQLGLGIKDLESVSDAFFTFEKATEASARLSQAFGVNIDSMAMLKAENPADQISMLRTAFDQAGQSMSSMGRHQKQYIAQTLGMSAKSAELMLSQEAQFMSQDELAAAMADTDPQQQMVNSLKDVGKEMKSIVVTLHDMGLANKGFFGAFTQGLTDGLFKFGPFADTASTVAEALMEMYGQGMDVAEMIASSDFGLAAFSAVKKVVDELPKIFKSMTDSVMPFFDALLNADVDAMKESLAGFGENFTQIMKDLFEGDGMGAGIADSLAAMWEVASTMFMENVWPKIKVFAADIVTKIWEGIKEFAMENKKVTAGILFLMFPGAVTAVLSGAGKMLGGLGRSIGALARRNTSDAIASSVPSPAASGGFFAGISAMVTQLIAISAMPLGQAAKGAFALGMLITIGLLPLGLAVIGLGMAAKGAKIDIQGTAALLKAMGFIMLAMTPMLVIAAVLGAMMMATPFGTAGVLIIAAGFVALGLLAGALVGSLIPVIQALAQAAKDIPNPAAVEAVAGALDRTLSAVSGLMMSIGPIIKALRPNRFSASGNGSFANNMQLFMDLIDKIMDNMIKVVNALVDASVRLAASPEQVQAAGAIAGVIGALAELMKTFAPNLDAMSDQDDEGLRTGTDKIPGILKSLTQFYKAVMPEMSEFAGEVIKNLMETVVQVGGAKKVKETAEAVVPMFEAIRNLVGTTSVMSNRFSDFNPEKDQAKQAEVIAGLKFIKKMFGHGDMGRTLRETVEALGEWIDDMSQTFAGSGSDASTVATTLKNVLTSLNTAMGMSLTLSGLAVAASGFQTRLIRSGLLNFKTVMSDLKEILLGTDAGPGVMTMFDVDVLGDAAEKFEKIANIMMNLVVPSTAKLSDAVVSFAQKLPQINEKLETLDTIDIQAAMARVGATALFQQEDVDVMTGDRSGVTFNINIEMDAAEVARAMVQTNIVAGT